MDLSTSPCTQTELDRRDGSPVSIDDELRRMNFDFHRLGKWDRLQAVIEAGVLCPDAVEKLIPLDFWTACQGFAQRVGSLQRLDTAVQRKKDPANGPCDTRGSKPKK